MNWLINMVLFVLVSFGLTTLCMTLSILSSIALLDLVGFDLVKFDSELGLVSFVAFIMLGVGTGIAGTIHLFRKTI